MSQWKSTELSQFESISSVVISKATGSLSSENGKSFKYEEGRRLNDIESSNYMLPNDDDGIIICFVINCCVC